VEGQQPVTAKLIHREVRQNCPNKGETFVTHVYSNGDVWQISRDADRGVFASRITRGYVMRWFPSADFVAVFGYPDSWNV
jgi:hypothetical protein